MKIYYEAPADVKRYIDIHRNIALEDKAQHFENYLRPIRNFKEITPETEILEIGTGTGWFPLLCKLRGLRCKGLEISPQLIEMASETGRRYGVEPDIELGNLEDYSLPDDFYDVVIASSVFEHVEDWRTGINKVYRTLKPGGVLYFESTNKFSFTSGRVHGSAAIRLVAKHLALCVTQEGAWRRHHEAGYRFSSVHPSLPAQTLPERRIQPRT